MKLCYIWIEEYKGFINQGFNLDTEYIYNYSSPDSNITRVKNPQYIENFFDTGVANITGIIGKNASGKTNILELIQYISDGANTILNKPFFAIYSTDKSFIIYNYKMPSVTNNFKAEMRNYEGKIPEINSIFFSNVFDGRRHNFGKKIINICTNDLLNSQFGENINKNYQRTIQQQIKFIKSPHFELLENVEEFVNGNESYKLKPSKVVLTSPIWSNIISRVKTFDERYKRETGTDVYLREFVLSFRKKITDNRSANSIKYFSAFLVYIDFVLNRDLFKYSENKLYRSKKEYHYLLKPLFNITQNDLRIDEIYKFFTNEFAILIDKDWNVFETHKFLIDLNEFDFGDQNNQEFKEDIGTYTNRRIQFTLDYNDRIGSFLIGYLNAITNQSLSYSVEWAGISSGHKAYLNLFATFYSITSRVTENNVLICIDEGDLYFHPKWQTEFLFKLINILPKLLGKKCQLFLTTHSPFLLSDLPKNNLLFVQKNETGNLEVIPNKKIEGETFGGNIGELYLDAFFMQGNLISHFAAFKIQTLVNKIRKNKREINDDDITLINEIGDELIRNQLIKLIDGKN
jgi:predicted ATPase